MKHFLTFDIGTTAVKTCLFDESFRLLSIANDEYQLQTSENGFVELDANAYWDAVCQGAKKVLQSSTVPASEIDAIAVTTQGETLIPIDADGNALHKAIVWLDCRAERQAEALGKKISVEAFYRQTGLGEINGYLPLAKLMWLRENKPEIYEKTFKFLLLEDYILYRFTGLTVTEKSLACSTGWFSLADDEYSSELLKLAEIDEEKLPLLTEPGSVLPMPVLPQIRTQFGFSDRIRIVTAAMDQVAGALGAGNISPGCVTETTGTALAIGASVEMPDFEDENRITVYRHVKKGLYLMMPFCMTGGMFLKWFKDSFCAEEILQAKQQKRSVYDILNEKAAEAPAGCGGLIALPYLTGSQSNPNMRAVFFGAGLDTDRSCFLRSVYEGVAFMLRENLELLCRVTKTPITQIHSLGGGAKSPLWRQIKADVCAIPVGLPHQTESTSLGAAMLCAVACGCYPSVQQAVSQVTAQTEWIKPTDKSEYENNYKKYRELICRLDSLF